MSKVSVINLSVLSRETVPVTVVIPCFNSEKTIRRAIDSVLRQTARPEEIILVDDCSRDDTLAILNEYVARAPLQVISLGVNKGPSHARNIGWDNATKPYIAFLDADDEWHPQKLEIQFTWMVENPQMMISGHLCPQYIAGMEGEMKSPHPIATFTLFDFLLANRFSTPSVMLRRDIPQRFPVHKRYSEDYGLWLEILTSYGPVSRLELPLAWLHKAPYGAAGLSANLWAMELGELDSLRALYRNGHLSVLRWLGFSAYSLMKYLRRTLRQSLLK